MREARPPACAEADSPGRVGSSGPHGLGLPGKRRTRVISARWEFCPPSGDDAGASRARAGISEIQAQPSGNRYLRGRQRNRLALNHGRGPSSLRLPPPAGSGEAVSGQGRAPAARRGDAAAAAGAAEILAELLAFEVGPRRRPRPVGLRPRGAPFPIAASDPRESPRNPGCAERRSDAAGGAPLWGPRPCATRVGRFLTARGGEGKPAWKCINTGRKSQTSLGEQMGRWARSRHWDVCASWVFSLLLLTIDVLMLI